MVRVLLFVLVAVIAALVRAVSAAAVMVSGPVDTASRDGELHVVVRDAATRRPIAARVRIVSTSALRPELVSLSRQGNVRHRLPRGGYRVIATHGPEWSIAQESVELGPSRTLSLSLALTRLVDAVEYTGCDLHLHTDDSPDSQVAIDERITALLAEDVQFAVISNHNVITDASERLARAGIAGVPGVEVTTWAPEFGHFNVFPRRSAPRYTRTTPADLLREIRGEHDSFVQINHPRLEPHIGYFVHGDFRRTSASAAAGYPLAFDGLEVWNGYDLSIPERRDEIFLDWLALVARGQHITATGGSDAHATLRPPFVGLPRTYVQVPRVQPPPFRDVIAALKRGRAFVSNGPLLRVAVAGRAPGDIVQLASPERPIAVDVALEAPAWMGAHDIELWLGEQRVLVEALPPPALGERAQRNERRFHLPPGRAKSLVVVARGRVNMRALTGRDATPYAFTNPIWLKAR